MRKTFLAAVAAALAAGTLLTPAAHAQQDADCLREPCYVCVMYPCGPGDWVELVVTRAGQACRNVADCPL